MLKPEWNRLLNHHAIMKNIKSCAVALSLLAAVSAGAQESSQRYIEVSGTSEIEIVPDKIHYIIEIKEYLLITCLSP